MSFKLGMAVDLCMAQYNNNIDLNARSQWVGRGTNSALKCLDNQASNIYIYALNLLQWLAIFVHNIDHLVYASLSDFRICDVQTRTDSTFTDQLCRSVSPLNPPCRTAVSRLVEAEALALTGRDDINVPASSNHGMYCTSLYLDGGRSSVVRASEF